MHKTIEYFLLTAALATGVVARALAQVNNHPAKAIQPVVPFSCGQPDGYF